MAEEVTPDEASWAEIQVTCLFTAASAGIFLFIFEFARRNPAVSAVFDRRRSTKPNRTPPPLIRSRYFEWLFLSTDPAYCEYAEMAHAREVIRERKRQQRLVEMVERFRLPYNIKKTEDDEDENHMTVIEEEQPKKKKKKRKKDSDGFYPSTSIPARSSSTSMSSITLLPSTSSNLSSSAAPLSKADRESDGDVNESARSISQFSSSSSLKDLREDKDSPKEGAPKRARFHPEVPSPPRRSIRGRQAANASVDMDSAGDSSSSSSSSSSEDEDEVNIEEKIRAAQSEESVEVTLSSSMSPSNTAGTASKKRKLSRKSAILTPDVVEVNGRRLPANIAAWAIAGDLTEEQLDQYERELIEREREEERIFKERHKQLNKRKRRSRGRGTDEDMDDQNDGEDDSQLGLSLPSRWGYLATRQDESGRVVDGIRNVMFKIRKFGQNQDGEADLDQFDDEPTFTNHPRSYPVGSSPLGSDSNRSVISSTASSSRHQHVRSSPNNNKYSPSSRTVDSAGASKNRHLKSADVGNKRPLSIADSELLRCVGLDTFVMVRFLRFGFDVTFYPFLVSCVVLFPTYYTNPYEGEVATETTEEVVTGGYFRITMNRLEPGSPRLWISWAFSILYFAYVLRRIWIEWETFIALRFDFLANGDAEMDPDPSHDAWMRLKQSSSSSSKRKKKSLIPAKEDEQLHLEQYRNSCIVEYIPDSHRRDKELFEFFNAVFPGQVKRAEILLNANKLTKLIDERQKYIELYETTYAKHFHAKQVYRKKTESWSDDDVGMCAYICCRCLGHSPKAPPEPKVKIRRQDSSRAIWNICCSVCQKKMVKALPYYLSEIKRLNREVECEHRRIMEERQKSEDKYISQNILASNLAQTMKFMTGVGGDLTCDTGFVEFKNLTTKQSALQCNITGTNNYMLTKSAPDPRDIVWENATVERGTINIKKFQMDMLLFTGTLFWSVVVIGITSISNLDRLNSFIPDWLIPEEDSFWYGLIQGYLPVIVLELLMLVVLFLLRVVGEKVIRFKAKSEVDKFVFRWHFGYRVANLVIIIVSRSLIETLDALRTNPQDFIFQLAIGISASSQFFLNNMIVAAGTETLWELAQITNMVFHFVMHKITTVEAMSKRALEKLEEAEKFEWGEVVPTFIFSFLVASVYVTIVPLVMGACALFFYIATKVYTHQVLFVYAQPYEGGGKLMYLLNRTVFVIIYISICIFATVLGLKEAKIAAPSFFSIMMMTTVIVDKKIKKTFVEPSVTLALTNSRLVDEENKRIEERALRYQEYKAAKLERKRQIAKAAKAAAKESKRKGGGKHGKGTTDETKSLLSKKGESSPARKNESGESNSSVGSQNKKSIQFKVSKEDTVEQLLERQARHAKKPLTQYGTPIKKSKKDSFHFDNDSDEEEDQIDFYLYRQPQLNKSLWETKPRPYR